MSKINQKVREYILSLDDNKDLPDQEIIDIITTEEVIWEGDYDKRRHWTTSTCIVKIGEMFIGYEGATGGDIHDRGWEFDPSTICEMEEYVEPVKKYRVKK
jgi:hypothetical protein